jgi:hypothetical protein
MPRVPSASGGALPRWLIVGGSAAILFHLAAIIIPILDMPSGPWAKPMMPRERPEPEFAHAAGGLATLHADYPSIAHSYHFVSNRPGDIPGVELDVILRDEDGTLMKTLRFPDPDANPWLRHRQGILASALAPDLPVESPKSDVIPPPLENPVVDVWALQGEEFPPRPDVQPPADNKAPLALRKVPKHLVPRYRNVWGPSEWSLVLVRSYARYLCRTHGADTAEFVRHTREPVSYSVLLGNGAPELDEIVASYGRMKK